ncbi:MAG: response regulator transcription factor [Deltaproteobacteria bacterium]|nr:response regulator transcription factor [Deltaproteobacteria bacterium]
MGARILVVDDERNIRDVVEYALAREGYAVTLATNGVEALDRIASGGIDLVVLDILMPEMDGLAVCRKIRETSALPIIFLSSRSEEIDRVLGLDLGSDDYVAKPFSPRELVSRVKSVLRRASGRGAASGDDRKYACGDVELNLTRHEVAVRGKKVEMTATEFGVLCALLEHPGRVLSRAQLVDRAYRHDNVITERTIDTHVRRIRAKLRPFNVDPIETVHGVGYKARDPDTI